MTGMMREIMNDMEVHFSVVDGIWKLVHEKDVVKEGKGLLETYCVFKFGAGNGLTSGMSLVAKICVIVNLPWVAIISEATIERLE